MMSFHLSQAKPEPEDVFIVDVVVGPHQVPEQEGTDEWAIIVEVLEHNYVYEDEVVGPFSDLYNIQPNQTYRLYWHEDKDTPDE